MRVLRGYSVGSQGVLGEGVGTAAFSARPCTTRRFSSAAKRGVLNSTRERERWWQLEPQWGALVWVHADGLTRRISQSNLGAMPSAIFEISGSFFENWQK